VPNASAGWPSRWSEAVPGSGCIDIVVLYGRRGYRKRVTWPLGRRPELFGDLGVDLVQQRVDLLRSFAERTGKVVQSRPSSSARPWRLELAGKNASPVPTPSTVSTALSPIFSMALPMSLTVVVTLSLIASNPR